MINLRLEQIEGIERVLTPLAENNYVSDFSLMYSPIHDQVLVRVVEDFITDEGSAERKMQYIVIETNGTYTDLLESEKQGIFHRNFIRDYHDIDADKISVK